MRICYISLLDFSLSAISRVGTLVGQLCALAADCVVAALACAVRVMNRGIVVVRVLALDRACQCLIIWRCVEYVTVHHRFAKWRSSRHHVKGALRVRAQGNVVTCGI
jgi:hypothetical protein